MQISSVSASETNEIYPHANLIATWYMGKQMTLHRLERELEIQNVIFNEPN